MDIHDLSDDLSYSTLLENGINTLQSATRKRGQKPSTRLSRQELVRDQHVFQLQYIPNKLQ